MKYYTVTGKSTEKPEGLPDGFEVEETDEVFERVIPCDEDGGVGFYNAVLKDGGDDDVQILLRGGEEVLSSLYFQRGAVKAFRNALTEFLQDSESESCTSDAAASGRGDEPAKPKAQAVVNHGDPEPPRDAVYVDKGGEPWSYEEDEWGFTWDVFSSEGNWDYVSEEWSETFPWTLKTG